MLCLINADVKVYIDSMRDLKFECYFKESGPSHISAGESIDLKRQKAASISNLK